MSSCKKSLGAVVAVVFSLVLLMAWPMASQAGVAVYWPDNFTPSDSSYDVYLAPDGMSAAGGVTGASFFCPVNIPIGRTITRFAYFHKGNSSAGTIACLYRQWLGRERELMAFSSSSDDTGAIITIINTTITTPVVTAGYRYFVEVVSQDNSNSILGVRIIYTP
jgi:hypothetical protein